MIELLKLLKQGFSKIVHILCVKVSHSSLASKEMLIEVVLFVEKGVTTRTLKTIEEIIYIICMKYMVVESQRFNGSIKSSNTSSS